MIGAPGIQFGLREQAGGAQGDYSCACGQFISDLHGFFSLVLSQKQVHREVFPPGWAARVAPFCAFFYFLLCL
jgi:hypothetical protein